MTKVKVFGEGRDIKILEKKINNFLEENNEIKIINICQSESGFGEGEWGITISIWYEESDRN